MDQIYTTTATRTKAVTSTQLAVATIALLGAAGSAFIMTALPRLKSAITPRTKFEMLARTTETTSRKNLKMSNQVYDGGFKPQPITNLTCIDTDNGITPLTLGTVTLQDKKTKQVISSATDVCADNKTVLEYFCDGKQGKDPQSYVSSPFPCPQNMVCMGGACVAPPAPTTTYVCADPDGGINLAAPAAATVTDLANGQVKLTLTDSCVNQSTVLEAFCVAQSGPDFNLLASYTSSSCPQGTECKNAACVPVAPSTTYSCVDGDNGQDIFARASTDVTDDNTGKKTFAHTDYCLNPKTVLEGFCVAPKGLDSQALAFTISSTCPVDFDCQNGICVATSSPQAPTSSPPKTPTSSFSCFDSDNGADYWIFGTTTEWDANGFVTNRFTDICESSTTISEGYCFNNRLVTSNNVNCGGPCQAGKCVR